MFDIGFFELCIIGVVALLVLGPERLPRAARTAGMWVGRAKRMVSQVKRDIDDELRQEELAELREAKESLSKTRESMNSFQQDLNQQVDTDDGGKKKTSAAKPSNAGTSSTKSASSTDPSTQEESTSAKPAAEAPASKTSNSGTPADSEPNASKTQ